MKKWLKILIIIISVVLALAVAVGLFLHFASPKYKIEHGTIERVYIYHNELGREYYEFTEEEKQRLIDIVENADIGACAVNEYEAIVGGPWFSFCCEMTDDSIVQIYCANGYLHLNSIPYKIDTDSAEKIANMHTEIDGKVLPISEEEYQEILNNRKNQR